MPKQVFPVDDFSGGLTENFIPGQPNQYLAADNLILVPSGSGKAQFKTRPGSQVIDTTNARLPTGDQRVSELINFDYDTALLAISGTKLYHYAAGPTWTSLLGPTSNNPFPAGAEATVHRHANWKGHLFVVSDSGDLPIKVYKDGAGDFQVRTAGLPQVSNAANVSDATLLTNLIALAVELRTQMMAHYNDWQAADVGSPFIVATGGTITTVGDYKVHTFTASGTFEITNNSGTVESLVVAGGGGARGGYYAGGGGGGGVVHTTPGASLGVGSYTVTIGAGGSALNSGANSVFNTITATGGGVGGGVQGYVGGNGGSGGGGAENNAGGSGTAGQGFAGGTGFKQTLGDAVGGGGGGGGAGAVGANATSSGGGAGGAGVSNSISGTATLYGGGGGGEGSDWGNPGGAGGTGGGGAGGNYGANGTNGTANTGGGGGGRDSSGGSGIVIVKYRFQQTASEAQHKAKHTAAYDALDAWVTPTNLNTLLTAIDLLSTQYGAHIDDAQLLKNNSASGDSQTWHWDRGYKSHNSWTRSLAFSSDPNNSGQYPILNFDLNPQISTGTTLLTARLKLNDLRLRWNLHTYSILTHGALALYGKHQSTVSEVDYSTGPTLAPQANNILSQWAGTLMTHYHAHIADNVAHTKAGTTLNVSGDVVNKWTADPYSLETKLIVLAHLEHQFWQHSGDADYAVDGDTATYAKVVGTSTNTSRVITAVTTDPRDVYATGDLFARFSVQTAVNYLWQDETASSNPAPFTSGTASIESMTVNSITLPAGQEATATYVGKTFIFSVSKYHMNPNQSASAVSYSLTAKTNLHNLDPDFSLAAIVLAYQAFRNKYYAHIQGRPTSWGVWPEADTTGSQFPTHSMSYIPASLDASALYTGANDTLLATALSVGTYLYQFLYRFPYSVGTVDYEDYGPIMTVPRTVTAVESSESTSVADTWAYPIIAQNIPSLVNTSAQNYGNTEIYIEVYRTIADGTQYYKVGQIQNNSSITTFSDNVADDVLTSNLALYTNGGRVSNDPAPVAKALHIVDNFAYYGDVVDIDGSLQPNRVRKSIEFDPDSCPSGFYDDLDSQVKAISSFKHAVIVFCVGGVYRLSGGFNLLGQGELVHETISDKTGCECPRSVVQTELGVFFAGTDGFYWTDGYQVQLLTPGIRDTYAAFTNTANQKKRIAGQYDMLKKQIWWTVQVDSSGTDCDIVFILNLLFQTRPFTTASNGTSWRPSCLGYYGGQLYRGDERGYVFKHSTSYTTDPRVDTAVGAVDWVTKAIRFNYLSCAFDFGETAYRKSATVVDFLAKDTGDLSVQINSIDDVGRHFSNLKPIRFRGNSSEQGTNALIVLPPTSGETFTGMIDEWRRFVAGTQRFEHKQIQITTAWVVIENSDTLGLANSDGAANTVTLVNGANSWSANAVDYAIAFDTDGYVTEWTVATRTSNTVLTLSDPGGTLTTVANRKWVLRGYPRGEKMHLISYNIHYEILGKSQKDYGGNVSEGGANA